MLRRIPITSLGTGIKVKPAPYRVRSYHGEEHGNSKLTDAKARDILMSDLPQKVIAKEHGVNQSQVSRIKRQKAWVHVGDMK